MVSLSLFALQALIIAGGGSPEENYHSHLVHVESLVKLLQERGVNNDNITIFWADGDNAAPDRAVRTEAALPDSWLLRDDGLDKLTDPGATIENTAIAGFELRPAKRSGLQEWFNEFGPKLADDDKLLIAVTDHGESDPDGGLNTAITLWGERWTVKEMSTDLAPVNPATEVVIWMSQCHSGGFAELARSRERICGVFSAEPHRPAYGCFPELAGRPDVGHFMRLTEGLTSSARISAAHNQSLLTDDTPDTPHLMSDIHLMDALKRNAKAKGTDFGDWVEGALVLDHTKAEMKLIAQIATQYGLGVVSGYQRVLELLVEIDAGLYALDAWEARWTSNLRRARRPLTSPLRQRIQDDGDYQPSQAGRAATLKTVKEAIKQAGTHGDRIMAMGEKLKHLSALKRRLELQEAAAIRIAYLFMRLVDPRAIQAQDQLRYSTIRRCEDQPLWPESEQQDRRFVIEPTSVEALAPVSSTLAELESFRPGYFGLAYRARKGRAGAEVRSFLPGGPASASGLHEKDLIVEVDGESLNSANQLADFAVLTRPGTSRVLKVLRNNNHERISITAAPIPLPKRPLEKSEPVPPLHLTPYDYDAPLPAINAGRKSVAFFWATWCGPCKKALGPLSEWARARNASVVAITSENRAEVDAYISKRKTPFPFPIALDSNGSVSQLFEVRQFPTFIFIDSKGTYRERAIGYQGRIPLDSAKLPVKVDQPTDSP